MMRTYPPRPSLVFLFSFCTSDFVGLLSTIATSMENESSSITGYGVFSLNSDRLLLVNKPILIISAPQYLRDHGLAFDGFWF